MPRAWGLCNWLHWVVCDFFQHGRSRTSVLGRFLVKFLPFCYWFSSSGVWESVRLILDLSSLSLCMCVCLCVCFFPFGKHNRIIWVFLIFFPFIFLFPRILFLYLFNIALLVFVMFCFLWSFSDATSHKSPFPLFFYTGKRPCPAVLAGKSAWSLKYYSLYRLSNRSLVVTSKYSHSFRST